MSSDLEEIPKNEEETLETVKLDEVYKFYICGLCSVALSQAFDEEYNQKFKITVIKIILAHFNVQESTRATCEELINGDAMDKMEPYYQFILENKQYKLKPKDILRELLFIFTGNGNYSSRIRYFLLHLAYGLHLCETDLVECEDYMVQLLDNTDDEHDDEETSKRRKSRKIKRGLLIGAAALGGGILIGVTGGLAAPFLATGIGAVGAGITGGVGAFVTGASTAMGSTIGVAVVGSLFGGAGAGITGLKMNKRVGGLNEFRIEPFTSTRKVTIAICISGFLNDGTADFRNPWNTIAIRGEQYYLCWESKHLIKMGKSINYLMSYIKGAALTETLKLTALSTILSAVAWPSALLTVSSVIDNPWSVCVNRSELVGRTLADSLIKTNYGKRPVTLIGYSLGARVIFYCLLELASRDSNVVEDIIDDVYLIGAPVPASEKIWKTLDRVVASRIVNAYCSSDWMLKFLFRTATVTKDIAGLGPINWKNRRMCNIDLGGLVTGHKDYATKMPQILDYMGVKCVDVDSSELVLSTASSNLSSSKSSPSKTSSIVDSDHS